MAVVAPCQLVGYEANTELVADSSGINDEGGGELPLVARGRCVVYGKARTVGLLE